MWRIRTEQLAVGFLLLAVASVVRAEGAVPQSPVSTREQPVLAAPGGGEMVRAGRDAQHVISGRVSDVGRLTTGCGQPTPGPESTDVRR